MILDLQNLFSDQQAIVDDALSDNIIDLGVPGTPVKATVALDQDVGAGNPIPLLIQVTEDFTLLDSLTVQVVTDEDVAFGSATILLEQTILLADLLAGKRYSMNIVPLHAEERFLAINYIVNGANAGAGKIVAGISAGNNTNNNTY